MCRFREPTITLLLAVLLGFQANTTWAGDGHDHGEAPVATSGPALPRFTAVSDQFELVGVVNGKQITLYLDRYADSSPVKDAKLELEVGGIKLAVLPHADGEYETALAQPLKPGVVAVTATVIAGQDSDLLAGELDLHDDLVAPGKEASEWKLYLPWVLGGFAGLVLLVARWRVRASRKSFAGGAL